MDALDEIQYLRTVEMIRTSMDAPASLEARLAFINAAQLPPVHRSSTRAWIDKKTRGLTGPGKGRAAVVGSALLSFTSGVSRQDQQDVQDCVLYLEQYTDTKYDRESQWYEWLQHFTLGLWHLGWIHDRPVMLESHLTTLYGPITQSVLDVLKPISSGAMYNVAVDAFNALKNNLAALKLFSSKSARAGGRSFQVMPCADNGQGQLSMAVSHSWFVSVKTSEEFLFIKWEEQETTLVHHYGYFTLDRRRFFEIREAMLKKITDRSSGYFEELTL